MNYPLTPHMSSEVTKAAIILSSFMNSSLRAVNIIASGMKDIMEGLGKAAIQRY